ncbi:hypothetical protein FFL01_32820 [Flavobacterium flevense]|uniref:Uncharacterized protein n=1 Tax=Flavobacterium flevense TaxID=983 RepID=A0A4Y4B525_9FLAO|nr:hypothetical protein FFL01_32820 [Flavobacterium flevense]
MDFSSLVKSSRSTVLFIERNHLFYQIPTSNFQTDVKSNLNNFSIRPGGTVRVNVITISGQKPIHLTGCLMENVL